MLRVQCCVAIFASSTLAMRCAAGLPSSNAANSSGRISAFVVIVSHIVMFAAPSTITTCCCCPAFPLTSTCCRWRPFTMVSVMGGVSCLQISRNFVVADVGCLPRQFLDLLPLQFRLMEVIPCKGPFAALEDSPIRQNCPKSFKAFQPGETCMSVAFAENHGGCHFLSFVVLVVLPSRPEGPWGRIECSLHRALYRLFPVPYQVRDAFVRCLLPPSIPF